MASGGARLDPVIARDFLALGFTLTEGYGLTETAPVVAFNPLGRVKPGSVGVPLPGVASYEELNAHLVACCRADANAR
jgi:long-chain acyl-CoA synthetase